MHRGLWNFIAIFSGTVAIVSGLMTLASAGIGVQVYIPDIVIGGFAYKVDLIQIGQYAAYVFVIGQLLQALTPAGGPKAESYARYGSWIALALFALTLVVMCIQLGVDRGNVLEIRRTSSPFNLAIMLFGISLLDVFVLPWLKHAIYGTPGYGEYATSRDVAHADVLPRTVPVARRVSESPLIGEAHNCRIIAIDCRGQDVRFTPPSHDGAEPQFEILTPPRVA